jgi:hypothetical protein
LIGGECFVVDPESSAIHTFNTVGSYVWTHLNGERSTAQIVDLVTEEFSVDRETALRDLIEFIDSLDKKGLLAAD